MAECFLPVELHVDGHALAAQPRRHRLGEPFVIFHYQHSHGLSRGPACAPAGAGHVRPTVLPRMPGARVKDYEMNEDTGDGRDRRRSRFRRAGVLAAAVTGSPSS
jgi:hypothetical protein